MSNQTFDYGELRVTLTSNYTRQYDDVETGSKRSVIFYHANSQGELCPLGSIGTSGYNLIDGKRATLLVGLNPDNIADTPALARPTGYVQIWNDKGSGGKYDGAIWRPQAPAGYVAAGDVVNGNYNDPPDLNAIWCLRTDLAMPAVYVGNDIWNDRGSGSIQSISCWEIVPEVVGTTGAEFIPIRADTFRAHQHYDVKPEADLAFVPLLAVPNQFKPFTSRAPAVTPNTIPSVGDHSDILEQCRVTLPFICFYPPTDQRSLSFIQKPFCNMIRNIAWYVEGVWVNDTNGTFNREKKIKHGISSTDSQTMTNTVGVNVSASWGIKLVEFDLSLNYQFTHTSSSSFTEFREEEVTEKFDVPPKNATVLYSKHIWLKGSRMDSQVISQVEIAANDEVHFSGCSLA